MDIQKRLQELIDEKTDHNVYGASHVHVMEIESLIKDLEGMVLVPKEPTEKMVDDGMMAFTTGETKLMSEWVYAMYKAMINTNNQR